jgi:hypothetical protein
MLLDSEIFIEFCAEFLQKKGYPFGIKKKVLSLRPLF